MPLAFLTLVKAACSRKKALVKAACAIHYWLRMTSPRKYFPSGCVDEEDMNTGDVNLGTWRQELLQPLQSVSREGASNNFTKDAERLRREYARAFSTILSIPWQLERLHL